MAHFDIIMPKMGESIEEATITKWFVKEGDKVVEDDVLLEIATDKVDSEIPSPVEGIVKKVLYQQDETIAVGTVIAVIDMGGDASESSPTDVSESESSEQQSDKGESLSAQTETQSQEDTVAPSLKKSDSDRFYSPLVRKIAKEENVSLEELEKLDGSGLSGRVQKKDILSYLESRKKPAEIASEEKQRDTTPDKSSKSDVKVPVNTGAHDEVIEMSRMRKLIASHMIHSKQTSAHVTNMLEVDVTGVVQWRNKVKEEFMKRQGQKLTFMPVFMEATVQALREYPLINASVDGENIVIKKDINLGIAVSLEDNNLIVPNIKNADQLNLAGLTTSLNKIAAAARSNKLSPDDISGGTFTITNFGTFKNDIGTPIINQPEVAILAIGAIKKKPAVLETADGDVIAIRQKMWLSLTYDHRIIDGALGGAFLRRLGDLIEDFDANRSI